MEDSKAFCSAQSTVLVYKGNHPEELRALHFLAGAGSFGVSVGTPCTKHVKTRQPSQAHSLTKSLTQITTVTCIAQADEKKIF